MPNLDLPPETLDEIRQTEPLACPLCHDERGAVNRDLRVIDHGADSHQVGIVIRCSVGHVYLNAFVPLDGRIYLGTVIVDSPAGPETRN